ncbi:MAG: import component protein [Mucilaginibacter sp.]|nr:import component protein [Mucilaginibacter sp.]
MNNKTLSIVSYITLIGWLIAYFSGKDKADALLKYHLKQSLGLAIVSITLNIILRVIVSLVPSLAFLGMIGLVIAVFWILGIINAANSALKPVPVFGKAFENSFPFIG